MFLSLYPEADISLTQGGSKIALQEVVPVCPKLQWVSWDPLMSHNMGPASTVDTIYIIRPSACIYSLISVCLYISLLSLSAFSASVCLFSLLLSVCLSHSLFLSLQPSLSNDARV